MKKTIVNLALVLVATTAITTACSDIGDVVTATGGNSGAAGTSGGAAATGGSGGSAAGKNGVAGSAGSGGVAGVPNGGAPAGGEPAGGEPAGGGAKGGEPAGGSGNSGAGAGGEDGIAGAAGAGSATPTYTAAQVTRGGLLVRSMALCGGCHTATAGLELGGNAAFKGGALPAPNLTPDPTGLGDWTDQQIMNAFRNGVDDSGRHLDAAMPYWLFHNMSDADALSVVAFLRSLPPASAAVGAANPDAIPVTPLSPGDFPNSSLPAADPNYAAAQQGKYLVSGVAQCVKCHSPAANGLPAPSFFSGVAPLNNTTIFAPNITPDVTGISGWTAADVATALKAGTDKAGVALCGSMPSAAKGYGGFSDADAHAIGVYLTTIAAVSKPTAAPALEPACP